MILDSFTQSTIAMLAVINPVVCGTMLLQIQEGEDRKTRMMAALKVMSLVLIILVVAAFGGKYILNAFGISMDAFIIVGGIILAIIGFQMLDHPNGSGDEKNKLSGLSTVVMFAASPGTIAMVITLAAVHSGDGLPISAVVGSFIAVLVSLGIIFLMLRFDSGKKSNRRKFMSRFMGLIILAMGLQFLLEGLKDFFR